MEISCGHDLKTVKEKRRVVGLPESGMRVEYSLMRGSSLTSSLSPRKQRPVVGCILHPSRLRRVNLENSVSLVAWLLNLLPGGLASHDDLRASTEVGLFENGRRPLSSCLVACQMGLRNWRGGHIVLPAHAVSGVTSLIKLRLKHHADCPYGSSRPFSLSEKIRHRTAVRSDRSPFAHFLPRRSTLERNGPSILGYQF